ncbi:MAG TPA: MBL fold metallo-hydrolase [bacterium]|nr:MBL fold metallo-hydrolase [bacterium]HPN34175.1 MBL fold metallo-hydrolase [bacterium]
MPLRSLLILLLAACSSLACRSGRLTFYFLDMVGGGSTLIVTPIGESLLIDTGSLEPQGRDDGRILQACRDAGLQRIDHLITTHFHSDHFGALWPVVQQIAVKNFYDKGSPGPEQEQRSERFRTLYPLYQQATGGRAHTLRLGDVIPLQDQRIELRVVAAEKKVLGFCGDIDAAAPGFEPAPPDHSDNGRSIALLLAWGDFRCFLGGDITRNVEYHLVSPVNQLGQVDLYQVTHHGLDLSNHPELIRAIQPVVAVVMNGPQKGPGPQTFAALQSQASLQGLYQLHYNTQHGDKGNAPMAAIANPTGDGPGNYVRVTVDEKAKEMSVQIGAHGKVVRHPFN